MPRNSVRYYRAQIGMSQAELADWAGTTQEQIAAIENGSKELTVEWAARLAPILKRSQADLMVARF